jgi:hypothetical protein
MGNQYLDIIWLVPALIFVGLLVLSHRLGIEVGIDRGRRMERERNIHPSSRNLRIVRNNDSQYWNNEDGTQIK